MVFSRYFNYNNNNNGNNQYYRNVRSPKSNFRSPRSAETNQNVTTITTNITTKSRTKRQIAFGREQLCQVRTQFVNPQAALNTQGNWMYVINQGQQATQLVKTEVCA